METSLHPKHQVFLDDLAAGLRDHRELERNKSQRINAAMSRLDKIARSFRTPTVGVVTMHTDSADKHIFSGPEAAFMATEAYLCRANENASHLKCSPYLERPHVPYFEAMARINADNAERGGIS